MVNSVDDQLRKSYGDLKKATDAAACAIALFLVNDLTKYVAIEQSAIGSTIDYFLDLQGNDDILIFNHSARLEVSGILCENETNTVDNRIKQKRNRLKPGNSLPTIIIIVEFSQPWSKMVEV